MKYIPNAMKFGTQSRSSSLIIDIVDFDPIEVVDLDLKLNTWADLVSKLQCNNFYEIWRSEQIEHANY